jgi:hypothetical protein
MQQFAAFAEEFVLLGEWKHKTSKCFMFGFSKHCFVAETNSICKALFQALSLENTVTRKDHVIVLDYNVRLPPYMVVAYHMRGPQASPFPITDEKGISALFEKFIPLESKISIYYQVLFDDNSEYLGFRIVCKCSVHKHIHKWAKEKRKEWISLLNEDTNGAIHPEELVCNL